VDSFWYYYILNCREYVKCGRILWDNVVIYFDTKLNKIQIVGALGHPIFQTDPPPTAISRAAFANRGMLSQI